MGPIQGANHGRSQGHLHHVTRQPIEFNEIPHLQLALQQQV